MMTTECRYEYVLNACHKISIKFLRKYCTYL